MILIIHFQKRQLHGPISLKPKQKRPRRRGPSLKSHPAESQYKDITICGENLWYVTVPRIYNTVLGCGYFPGGDYTANAAALLWGETAGGTECTASRNPNRGRENTSSRPVTTIRTKPTCWLREGRFNFSISVFSF